MQVDKKTCFQSFVRGKGQVSPRGTWGFERENSFSQVDLMCVCALIA